MSNILLTRQSNLFWHFFKHLKTIAKVIRNRARVSEYDHNVYALTRSCFYIHRRVRIDAQGCIRHNQHRTGHMSCDNRTTVLDRTYRLSSSWSYFTEECERLELVFSKLKYPQHLRGSTVKTSLNSRVTDQSLRSKATTENTTRVVKSFNYQESANIRAQCEAPDYRPVSFY